MALYCGIDLHSNNHWLTVIDEADKRLLEKRLPNDLSVTLKALAPYREELAGIAVESTFNWYWLVDGLMASGMEVRLVNTAAVKKYDGLKYADDRHDAFWLAHLMRLNILPTGYIYPKERRAVRDLLRRRMGLVRVASCQLISVQSMIWRYTGAMASTNQIRKPEFVMPAIDPHAVLGAQSSLALYRAVQREIDTIEATVLGQAKLAPEFPILQSMSGIGKILGMTVMFETGRIERFSGPGDYASYSRCARANTCRTARRKAKAMPRAGTSTFLGPSPKRRILRCATIRWPSVSMTGNVPRRTALWRSGPWRINYAGRRISCCVTRCRLMHSACSHIEFGGPGSTSLGVGKTMRR